MLNTLLVMLALPIALGAWRGYRKGALAQVVGLVVFGVSCAAAAGLARLGLTWPALRPIPLLLQPYLIAAAGALLLYALLSTIARLELRAMDRAAIRKAKEEGAEKPLARAPSRSPLNRWTGLVIGAGQGAVISAALLFGIHLVGQTVRVAEAALTPASAPGAPVPHRPGVPGVFREADAVIRRSPVAPLADRFSPVKDRQVEALGRLTRLTDNERALRRLAGRPELQNLLRNPRIRALSHNPEIARAVQQKRWSELLNRKEVLELSRDPDLGKWLGTTDFNTMLRESTPPADADKGR